MKSIWSTLYDDVKDRRYAVLFLLVLLAVFVCSAILAGITEDLVKFEHITEGGLLWAGGLVVGWALVWVFVAVYRARRRRSEGWERCELSGDEWRVARSKLKSGSDRLSLIKPLDRPPDTDLKM